MTMDQMKKNAVCNATFLNHSKLLNIVISFLQVLMPITTTTVYVSMAGLNVLWVVVSNATQSAGACDL